MSAIKAEHLFNHFNSYNNENIPTGIYDNYVDDDLIKTLNIQIAKNNSSIPVESNNKVFVKKNDNGNYYAFIASKTKSGYEANKFLSKDTLKKTMSKSKDIDFQFILDGFENDKKRKRSTKSTSKPKKRSKSRTKSKSSETKPRRKTKSRTKSRSRKSSMKSEALCKNVKFNLENDKTTNKKHTKSKIVNKKAGSVPGLDNITNDLLQQLTNMVVKDKTSK